jgi:alanyl-tRNA synthetase
VDANAIRKTFLEYFEQRGHTIVPSSSLLPQNDPTLYFVNAGMVPFKDVFTGKEKRDYSRATSSQKCLRVSGKHNDLENVGRTPRHHTMFEMLGNFSFGDYFKKQAIAHAWDLLTNKLALDADRLWVSVYERDDETYDLWRSIGFPESRLQRMGAKDNFWSMGPTGPCGPCTEIHYDHGPAISDDQRGPAGESDRYVEIWNLVFMQYDQQADGTRLDLPRPSVDTGMGLERLSAVLQGVYWNYDTDLFRPLIETTSRLAGVKYGDNPNADVAMRVVADHARATAFLVADGETPSNVERGYVLRRVMRRAIRFGVKLGIDRPFFHEITGAVADEFAATYPELAARRSFIDQVVLREEERFRRTLDKGMRLLDHELGRAEAAAGEARRVSGQVAFTLSDEQGFPLDLTQLIASERGIEVDHAAYGTLMQDKKARDRANWKGSGAVAVGTLWPAVAEQHGATTFTGYDHHTSAGEVLALATLEDDGSVTRVTRLEPGQRGVLVLDNTPFYAESGGQLGDSGSVGSFSVDDTTTTAGLHLHHGTARGAVEVGDLLEATVDASQRDAIRRNHTATHLLHAALQQVLGDHVAQKGSLVGPDRLRFDFTHHQPLTHEELRSVETLVNHQVLANRGVTTTVEDMDAAVARGAMALFGEKYANDVRVVEIPGFSVELCGGTHVGRTGDIGLFRLVSEAGVAASVRRIEAQTGSGALSVVHQTADTLDRAAARLKTQPDRLEAAIARLQEEKKATEKELAALKVELAKAAAGDLLGGAKTIDGVSVVAAEFDGDLREQADRLRDQLGTSAVVLAARRGERVQLLVALTKDIAGVRLHAGKLIKEIAPLVGGGGGGRPDMAQAGGKNAAGIPAALEHARKLIADTLSA